MNIPIKVYIVLLNYNGYKDTIECLESILQSDYNNYQIIVVDNSSTDNSMVTMLSWAKKLPHVYFSQREALEHKSEVSSESIIFIQSEKNGGFSSGNNIGIKYALLKNDFDYVWLLNNDTIIKRDSLSLLIDYAKSHDLGITGSSLLDYEYPHEIQSLGGYIHKLLGSGKNIVNIDEVDKIEYIVGASFLIKKIVFKKIGLLPEEYFLYYEDSDYCFNARDAGIKIGTAVNSIVYHKEGGTTGTSKSISNKSYMSDFHSFRSHKIFWKKYFKNRYLLIYLQLIVYIFHRLLHGKFKNIGSLINAFFQR